MFHVSYEVDRSGDICSPPRVGCNACRCDQGEDVRCIHHPAASFAIQTYLYFRDAWKNRVTH